MYILLMKLKRNLLINCNYIVVQPKNIPHGNPTFKMLGAVIIYFFVYKIRIKKYVFEYNLINYITGGMYVES